MADREVDTGAPPNPAPGGVTRVMVIILAALVVIALIAWFLLGSHRAPGPAAGGAQVSNTEAAFANTVITQPTGEATTGGGSATHPGIIEAPPVTNSTTGGIGAVAPATLTPNATANAPANTAR